MTEVLLECWGLDMLLRTDAAFGWTTIHYALYVGNEALASSLVERLCSGSGDSSEISERLVHAKQDVLRHMDAQLSLFRGLPSAVKVLQDDGVVAFSSFCSLRSNFCCPPGARGYYELVILEMDMYPQYGFACAAFNRVRTASSDGVGDDEESWAVDSAQKCKWHHGTTVYECECKVGDVVGLASDLEKMQMLISINGSFEAPTGCVFKLAAERVQHVLFAAFTGSSGKVQCNLGATPFKYAPTSADLMAFVYFHEHHAMDAFTPH